MSGADPSVEKAARYWSEYVAQYDGQVTGAWWETGPALTGYINRQVSGDPAVDWVDHTLAKYVPQRPLRRCLSLGCGSGHLERRLARQAAFEYCDAYDVAEGSIEAARKLATEAGLSNIQYQVGDINGLSLPQDSYDMVWVSGAMHHFEQLEAICAQISASLRPGGLLILNEYVGPSRFDFPPRQRQVIELCFQLLPARYRRKMPQALAIEVSRTPAKRGWGWFAARLVDKLRDGDLLHALQRRLKALSAQLSGKSLELEDVTLPSVRDVMAADPTEAIRSKEIIPVLQQAFEILERRDWGGTLLQFLLSGISGNFVQDDPDSIQVLKMLLQIEATLIEVGELQSDFTYIVARPRRHVQETS